MTLHASAVWNLPCALAGVSDSPWAEMKEKQKKNKAENKDG